MQMDTIILGIVVVALIIDRVLTQRHWMQQADRMNKAMIARSVPEYAFDNKAELEKLNLENELALTAHELVKDDRGPRSPVI